MTETFDNRLPSDTAQQRLFSLSQEEPMSEAVPPADDGLSGTPRFKAPNRSQIEFRACCWNDLLPDDHQARVAWGFTHSLDLSDLYGRIKAVVGRPGQPPIDPRKMAPMVEQHQERYGQTPDAMLVDGGFTKKDDITQVSAPNGSTTVYAPVQASKDKDRDPHTPRSDDSPAVAEWCQRMATPEAKEIYKERAATAECVNAIARNRGLYNVRVRGSPKVTAVVLWYVLAHNLMRAVALRATLVKN